MRHHAGIRTLSRSHQPLWRARGNSIPRSLRRSERIRPTGAWAGRQAFNPPGTGAVLHPLAQVFGRNPIGQPGLFQGLVRWPGGQLRIAIRQAGHLFRAARSALRRAPVRTSLVPIVAWSRRYPEHSATKPSPECGPEPASGRIDHPPMSDPIDDSHSAFPFHRVRRLCAPLTVRSAASPRRRRLSSS